MEERLPELRKTRPFSMVTSRGMAGLVFHLLGVIDGSSASQVLDHARRFGGTIILDFSGVAEIGEFGALVLGTGLKELRKAGITIEVDGLRPGLSHWLCLGGVFEAIASHV